MSQLSLHLKSGFAAATLANGIGRCVPQCQRMTIKFCLKYGNSRGVRDFIQHDLVEFARVNPGTVVYLKPRRHRAPVLVAEYLNGEREWLSLHEMVREEIRMWVDIYRTQAGNGEMHYRNYITTKIPSIQGPWTPFTHKPFERSILKYPVESLNTPPLVKPSTTEIIEKMFAYQEDADHRNIKVE